MAHTTPAVTAGLLTIHSGAELRTIVVGGDGWWRWLADEHTTTFRFSDSAGSFTARCELVKGSRYWYAYRKHAGRLRKAYLGKTSELTHDRLSNVAALLADGPTAAQEEPVSRLSPGEQRPRVSPPAGKGRTSPGSADLTVAGTDAPPLLALKLSVPSPAPRLVPRPRLLDRLDAGLDSRLTLICAPAGFGKTTLLADWLRHQPVEIRRAVAWLALDAADAEPRSLLRYLVAALQTVAPEVGASTLALLRSPQSLSIPALLTGLLNDLAALTGQTLLVLDDYHLLQGASAHETIPFLVEHLPPTLHLVIATREDPPLPLARLRARQQLTELRTDDLRFTPAEAASFLQQVMGLPLSPGEVLALEERTEGWITGLQLAALAIRERADVAGFVAAFTGSNRYILDYLGEEVFVRQPPHLQAFLLQTAILEHMCGALCDAVVLGSVPAAGGSRHFDTDGLSRTPRVSPGAYSQVLLDELERTNLFVVPLDDERRWYRYHHLFRDVLRARLLSGAGTDTVATLHRRAAGWYAQAGLVVEAGGHALAANDWVGAAELIEETAQTMIGRGEATTVGRWLDALPAEVVRTRARLSITAAWVLSFTPATDAMEVRLQDAERILIAGET